MFWCVGVFTLGVLMPIVLRVWWYLCLVLPVVLFWFRCVTVWVGFNSVVFSCFFRFVYICVTLVLVVCIWLFCLFGLGLGLAICVVCD